MTAGLPAFLQGYQSKNLAATAMASIGSGAPSTLSIEGGRFTIIDSSGETEMVGAMDPKIGIYCDVVIVDLLERKSKIFYGLKYDPSNPAPPKCFSDNGIAPSISAGEPQAPTCASCPNNVIGSALGLNNKPVRACRDQIKAAVVLPQYPEETFLLKIPPNSFKHFRTLSQFFEKNQTPMETCVVRVYFEQGITGTLMFHALGYIQDEKLFHSIRGLLAAKATDTLVGRTDVPRTALLPGPSPQALAASAVPAQAPALAPPQAFVSGLPAAQPMQMAPTPQAAPQTAAEPPKRRRRSAAAEAPQSAPQQPQMAPFQQPQSAATTAGVSQFGMQPGAPPNQELLNTLNSIFPPQQS